MTSRSDIEPPTGEFGRPTNRIVNVLLAAVPAVLGVAGVIDVRGINYLPTSDILDVTFFVSAALLINFTAPRISRLLGFLLLYVFARLLLVAFAHSAGILDTLQDAKWLLYLIALCWFVGKSLPSKRLLLASTKWLIVLAGCKYVIAVLLGGFSVRPELLDENNYEVSLFCGLLAVTYRDLGRLKNWYLIGLGLVVVLSESRSGAVAFVLVVVYIASTSASRNVFIRYLIGLASFAAIAIPIGIFGARTTSVESIDRVRFFGLFIEETRTWTPLNWLLGTYPMTPLSSNTCGALSYYSTLFSYSQPGVCYSVILHAFLLRVIFDAGIFGAVLAFGSVWMLLRRSGVELRLAILLVGLAITNSASVSGLNNVYVVLPIGIAMLVAREPQPDLLTNESRQNIRMVPKLSNPVFSTRRNRL